jgi:hypothetical protein
MPTQLRLALYFVVAAQTFLFLGAGLGLQLVVFMPLENAALPYEQSVWIYGAYGVVASVVYFAASIHLDRLPALRVSLGALVLGAAVRGTLSVGSVAASPAANALLLGVLMPTFDTLGAAPLYLALQRILAADLFGTVDKEREHQLRQRFFYAGYMLGNGMAVITSGAYDALRHQTPAVPYATANTQAALVAAIGMGLTALCVLAAQALVRRADHAPAADDMRLGARPCTTALRDPAFRRFFALCMVLIGVRALYRNFDNTLALYLVHLYGNDAHFSLVQMANPVAVLVLVPLCWWLLERADDYVLFIAGTTVSSAAPLALAAVLFFAGGSGAVGISIEALLVGMVVLFTLGECLWAPRLPNYALSESPTGSTALFFATSTLPTLLAKVVATLLSYWLVPYYCPQESAVACDGVTLWSVLGLVAVTTPLGLLVFEQCLRRPAPPDAYERE